ncbi:MAG: DUF2752 domain-containing protein [Geothrix sp.]|uniref:DUF2752 domain-containing protein n=1 Tax=Geothrix sp. TaxID=1962974 RepID=UPI003BB02B05
MKFRLERAPRLPRLPVWALVVLGCWLLLVVMGALLDRRGGPALETCLLHRLSGHPCPTCGSTRVVLALGQGAWVEALRLNPLVTLGLVLGTLGFGLRLATGRTLRMELSSREQKVALAVGLAALAVNWLWVLRTQA